jgi:mono/diheme cytochrome c family protein
MRMGAWGVALCVAGVVACGGGRPRAFDGQDQGVWEGRIMSRDIERGEFVFHHTCAACHRGRVNPSGYGWEPWRMRRQVREGNTLMPPLSEGLVSPDDLEAVLAYLTTIGAVDAELPPPPVGTEERAVATSLGPGEGEALAAPPQTETETESEPR